MSLLCAYYLALIREEALSAPTTCCRRCSTPCALRADRCPRRLMPRDLPPWAAVQQQAQRWIPAGVFETMVHAFRALLRLTEGCAPEPTATVLDSHTPRSTFESGEQASYDGAKRLTRARRSTWP